MLYLFDDILMQRICPSHLAISNKLTDCVRVKSYLEHLEPPTCQKLPFIDIESAFDNRERLYSVNLNIHPKMKNFKITKSRVRKYDLT